MRAFNVYRWRRPKGRPAQAERVAVVEARSQIQACAQARSATALECRLFARPQGADPYEEAR